MTSLALLWRFASFGILCFGGGYMLVPLLFNDLVTGRKILDAVQFGNLVSVAQLTPGPVGINAATYAGFIENGFPGSVAATAGLVLPTLILSMLAVLGLHKYRKSFAVQGILTGVRPAALGLVFYASIIFLGLSVFPGGIPWRSFLHGCFGDFRIDWISLAIFSAVFIALNKTKISAPALILGGAALGALTALL
ncbi:MAG: chromate transporter [Victivallaceae bacterium]|nr:chromate transporter [Victivallaceae bacterium]